EQALALSAQAQRDTDRQLQQLSVRRERLQAQAQGLQRPDTSRLAQLAGDLAAATDQLEQAEAELLALEERVPRTDAERRAAQQAFQREAASASAIEARLAALLRLQQDVQQQGALQPWLQQHDLAQRSRLWQRLQITPGWETALEAVLAERTTALEISDLDWTAGFLRDAPPARIAFYQLPRVHTAPATPPGFTSLASLVRVSEADAGL